MDFYTYTKRLHTFHYFTNTKKIIMSNRDNSIAIIVLFIHMKYRSKNMYVNYKLKSNSLIAVAIVIKFFEK